MDMGGQPGVGQRRENYAEKHEYETRLTITFCSPIRPAFLIRDVNASPAVHARRKSDGDIVTDCRPQKTLKRE
jgi:hypothetical protein